MNTKFCSLLFNFNTCFLHGKRNHAYKSAALKKLGCKLQVTSVEEEAEGLFFNSENYTKFGKYLDLASLSLPLPPKRIEIGLEFKHLL